MKSFCCAVPSLVYYEFVTRTQRAVHYIVSQAHTVHTVHMKRTFHRMSVIDIEFRLVRF